MSDKLQLPERIKVDGKVYRVHKRTWSPSRGDELYLSNKQGQPVRTCPHNRHWKKGMILQSSGCKVEYI